MIHTTIRGKNLSIDQALHLHIDRKIGRLERYLQNIAKVEVEVSRERSKSQGEIANVQITVRHSRGLIFRAEDKSQNDTFTAVDLALDKIERQIRRYKETRRRRGNTEVELGDFDMPVDDPDAEIETPDATIVRRKQLDITPMSEQEAIDQMEMLGHDFFVFFNAAENAVNVLYRRKEGNYGLLQPVFGR
jgi:putative sigma-54 modulation protein